MKRINIGYFFKEGFLSVFSHGLMSFAAVCMIVACLLIMGSFTLLAVNLDNLVRQYNKSAKAISQEASLKREITSAKQALSRAEMLYDSLFQNYADKLMSEREYTEMKRQYRSDMERAQARLDELEQQQDAERRKSAENPWLTACAQFKEEQALTEAMAHALIERVEVDAENHVSITLRYRDEYRALLQLLETEREAVSA